MKKFLLIISFLLIPVSAFPAVSYTGSTEGIACGTADILGETGTYTVSAWIYANSLGASSAGRIIGKELNGVGMRFGMVATNALVLNVSGSTGLVVQTSNSVINFSQWYHIVLTSDGSVTAANYHIYINGVETTYATQTNMVTPTDNSASTIEIGNRNSDMLRGFDGYITDVAIWNVILTPQEIRLLANSRVKYTPLLIETQSLQAYWPLDQVADGVTNLGTNVFLDMSGKGNHGTGKNLLKGKSEEVLSYP